MKAPLRAIVVAVVLVSSSALPSEVSPGYRIELPRDGGSHPEFRTEWWYLTGWLKDENGVEQGFQVTFFRVRNPAADANPSKFAPRQLLFAHAALSHPVKGRLLKAERTARAGFGLAEASENLMSVHIDDWSLKANGHAIVVNVAASDFAFSLELMTTQAPLLQGDDGYSRKGPNPAAASYYYSLPQLQTSGALVVEGRKANVTGVAWFDHEWSNAYVDTQAVGWDWLGLNLHNGGAVMVFRMRDAKGSQHWAGGSWRDANGDRRFAPQQIQWTELRRWQSALTGVEYPIAWRVRMGSQEFTLRPLMDNQENDARGSVGILYWEGAVEAYDQSGKSIGRGYLELTGYDRPVRL